MKIEVESNYFCFQKLTRCKVEYRFILLKASINLRKKALFIEHWYSLEIVESEYINIEWCTYRTKQAEWKKDTYKHIYIYIYICLYRGPEYSQFLRVTFSTRDFSGNLEHVRSSQRAFSTPRDRFSRKWCTWTFFILNLFLCHVQIRKLCKPVFLEKV